MKKKLSTIFGGILCTIAFLAAFLLLIISAYEFFTNPHIWAAYEIDLHAFRAIVIKTLIDFLILMCFAFSGLTGIQYYRGEWLRREEVEE